MSGHFADRWLEAVEAKASPVCVGLDPALDRLPEALTDSAGPIEAVREFCRGVIEAVADVVPAVKPQSAYFEALGPAGAALYGAIVREAKDAGLIVIGDVKRGDIGSTAEAYAAAHLAGEDAPDAVTVNAYFGADGLQPFLHVAHEEGKGVFALVRTSNPSAGEVQDFADAGGTKFYQHMADLVARLGGPAELIGGRGYSLLGAVVGATWPREARELRQRMPQQVFLVPGYGAQGATAADCAAAFKDDGTGAIVNASRSVLYAHRREDCAGLPWRQAVAKAAREFADDVAAALTASR